MTEYNKEMIEFILNNLPKVEFVLAAWIGVAIAVFIDLATGNVIAQKLDNIKYNAFDRETK